MDASMQQCGQGRVLNQDHAIIDMYSSILKANLSWTRNQSKSSDAKNFRMWFFFLFGT